MKIDLGFDEPPYIGPSEPVCSGCDEPIWDCVCELLAAHDKEEE